MKEHTFIDMVGKQVENAREYTEKQKKQNALEKYMIKFYEGNDVVYRCHQFQIFGNYFDNNNMPKEENERVYEVLYSRYFPALEKTIWQLNDINAYPELYKGVNRDEVNLALQEAYDQMQILIKRPPVDAHLEHIAEREKEAEPAL